jgi:hypothetical protein
MVGRECRMPQPVGPVCTGVLVDMRPRPESPKGGGAGSQGSPTADDRIFIVFSGETVKLGDTVRPIMPDDIPDPEPILSERARQVARDAFMNGISANVGVSLDAALEAVVGIIAADNVERLARGIDISAAMMQCLGQTSYLTALATVSDMMREYADCVDPGRPKPPE